ncbi:hypothetical protein DVH05_000533 [Phytophthora capsici]|nr:hypothetical protein DVH05_000533 [Phytophthora capsici]
MTKDLEERDKEKAALYVATVRPAMVPTRYGPVDPVEASPPTEMGSGERTDVTGSGERCSGRNDAEIGEGGDGVQTGEGAKLADAGKKESLVEGEQLTASGDSDAHAAAPPGEGEQTIWSATRAGQAASS